MHVWVIFVQNKVIVPMNNSPTFDARHYGRFPAQFGFGLYAAIENGADNAFMNEGFTGFEPALSMPLRQPGRGTRATGRTVDSLVAVENGIAGGGAWVQWCTRPENMAQSVDSRVFGVHKCVVFV